jgi:Flp pilus assembly protein TadG
MIKKKANRMKRVHITKNERGQAVVEFAIIVPLLALLLFAILQFGIVFNNYLTLTDAVRAGARKAAVSRHIPTGRHNIVEAAVRASAEGIDNEDLDVRVSTSWEPASDVEVTASYPYSINVLGLVVASGRIESKTTERVE